MTIQVLASGSAVTGDSLVIPVANLAGFNSLAVFQNASANINFTRFLMGFVEKSYNVITATNFLRLGIGLQKTITTATTVSNDSLNFNYTTTLQKYVEQDTAPVALPLPSTGTNLGLGDFDLITIFAGATKVANGSNVAADAIAIAVSQLTPYGSPAYGSINLASGQDNRGLWMSIIEYLFDNTVLRVTGTTTSPVVTKSIAAPTVPTVPTAYIATTNPTTGINSSFLYGQAYMIQQILGVSVELIYDNTTLGINVNNV